MTDHRIPAPRWKPRRDERFANFLRRASAFLQGTDLEYAVFGSVAVCAWLPFAPFLPKDLDVVVSDRAYRSLVDACWEWDLPLQQEAHFARVSFGHYELNVVPEQFTVFRWRSDTAVAGYDLSLSGLEVTPRPVRLLPVHAEVTLPVPRPEYLLVTGIRVGGANTESLQRSLLLLAEHTMDVPRLDAFLARCTDVRAGFEATLQDLEDMVTPFGHPALAELRRINRALRGRTER